ncbi:MAG: D-2-hydroxyacid dehydrogenase family protein [Bacteroidetes bacterium]|jgi:D-3-phosphoglycerate dehydrogenase|nr:D-2-hydroxyacid dehydrogenase family protein [Bacteroidota bacterium]MDF1866828.1 D-2-hydroxyacid dehydrogenase family protein [Saprospiraceae bacterium]
MRISIPDDFQKVIKTLDCFQLLSGHEITILHDYISNETELAKRLNDPEILVLTRTRTKITESLLKQLPNLKLISQTGKNAGHIDIEACNRYGVAVAEGRGNPIATAELTWALIMNGLRQIPQAIEGMKAGQWQINIGRRVFGKRIGIWGYGKIGKRIVQYAKLFGAEVMIWGSEASRKSAKQDGFLVANSKEEFFSTCDVVSLHLRLKDTTREIVKKEDLLRMKSDALFVNTARAGLIEKGALLEALKMGKPGFAAIDVYDKEPIFDPNHLLLQMQNVVCTPHLGYVERAGYESYFSIAFVNVVNFIFGKPTNIANPEVLNNNSL